METLPLSDIIITIDTHEEANKKEKTRTKLIEEWGKKYGATVEYAELELCDYRIMGIFQNHEIMLGIEYKTMSNFLSDDYQENKTKLFDSFELYDDVALFIETGNYEFEVHDFCNCDIFAKVKKDLTLTGKLAVFEGCCSTLPAYGIHVRQLRSEAQFPYSIENLLTYCIHDHDIVKSSPAMYLRSYKHTLRSFMTNVQVKKALTCYPNLFWLCSASEESYKEILGNKAGTKLYGFVRNPELVTKEWRNKHFNDGTDKVQPPELEICDKIKEAIVDYLTMVYPRALTIDEICSHFNIAQGDDDKEAFLIYIKELAWEKKITNTVSGELTITRELQNTKLQSRCDPAGTFLDKVPPSIKTISTPVDDNDKKVKACTNIDPKTGISKYDSDTCQQEQCVGCDDCKDYKFKNDNDKSTEGLLPIPPQIIPSVPISNHKGAIQREPPCDTDPGFSSTIIPSPKTKLPGQVQEKDLKLASSSILLKSSPAITPDKFQQPDVELFGKTNPDWKVETHRMSARVQLEAYLQNPHTLQECVDAYSQFTSGTIYEHIARMKKEGVVIKFDDKTLVMAK